MNQLKIGLDRIMLDKLIVCGPLDIAYLRRLAATGEVDIDITENCGNHVLRIKIMDNLVFQELLVGHDCHEGRDVYYTHLRLSPSNIYGDNMDNVSWTEYCDYLAYVVTYIEEVYKIHLDCRRMRLREAEINCNIPLKAPYADYDRPVRLLLSLLPMHLRTTDVRTSTSKGESPEPTYLRCNKTMGVSIYNKSAQMSKKQKSKGLEDPNPVEKGPDIMRLEIRLNSEKKIQSEMGTNWWFELSDAVIQEYFLKYFYKRVFKKYTEWYEHRRKAIHDLIDTMRAAHPKRWHTLTMMEIRNKSQITRAPYILDIEQVEEVIRQFPDPHKNCSHKINTLHGGKVEDDVYYNRDCDKVIEIFQHLGLA